MKTKDEKVADAVRLIVDSESDVISHNAFDRACGINTLRPADRMAAHGQYKSRVNTQLRKGVPVDGAIFYGQVKTEKHGMTLRRLRLSDAVFGGAENIKTLFANEVDRQVKALAFIAGEKRWMSIADGRAKRFNQPTIDVQPTENDMTDQERAYALALKSHLEKFAPSLIGQIDFMLSMLALSHTQTDRLTIGYDKTPDKAA